MYVLGRVNPESKRTRVILFIRMPPWDKWNTRSRRRAFIEAERIPPREMIPPHGTLIAKNFVLYAPRDSHATSGCESYRKLYREVLIEIKRDAINIRVSRQQIKRQPFPPRHLDQPWTKISIELSEISRRPFLGSSDPASTKAHCDCFSRDNVVGERRAFRERESRARPIIAKLMKLFQESREREPAGASTATLPISFLFLYHPSRDASTAPCVASSFFSSSVTVTFSLR